MACKRLCMWGGLELAMAWCRTDARRRGKLDVTQMDHTAGDANLPAAAAAGSNILSPKSAASGKKTPH